jgi:hypothetical protein
MPSSVLCRVDASVTEVGVANPDCDGCSAGPAQVDRDVPLGIVMQFLRERFESEEFPWNDSLKIHEQSGSFAQDR